MTAFSPKPSLLLVDDPRFLEHRPPGTHPERPERLVAAKAAVASANALFVPVASREATDNELERAHDASFVEQLTKQAGGETYLDADTYLSKGSVTAARVAAGSTLAMVDHMIDGPIKRGVALVRPPGHHARSARAMGFCLLNNVAVAAAHARARGLSRIAIMDWDVHHGNGTQEIFYRDPNVLYVSTHQYPFYPGTGAAEERGANEGEGFTVNVPLTSGGGDAIYRGAFERIVLPVLDEFSPELILVSAGFDAALRDPLAEMRLSTDAFGWMAQSLSNVAEKHAQGRIALVLEGGYDLPSLESGLLSAIHGMTNQASTEISRDVDAHDLLIASNAAKRVWKRLP